MELDVDATGQPRLEGPVPSPIVPDSVVAKMREESQLRRRRAREAEEDSEGLPVRMPVDKPLPSPPVEEVPQVGEEVKVVAEDEVKVQVEEEKVVEKELPSVLEKELEVLEKDLPKTPEMPKEMPKINTNIPEEVRKAEPEDGSTTPTLVLDTKDLPPGKVRFGDLDFSVGRPKTDEAVTVDQAPPKKKKTHRGQRGGAKKRKNKEAAIERAQKELEDRVIEGVEQMVDDKLQNDKEITPDVKMERGDIVINNLHISTEKVLGKFTCWFDLREVANKMQVMEVMEQWFSGVGSKGERWQSNECLRSISKLPTMKSSCFRRATTIPMSFDTTANNRNQLFSISPSSFVMHRSGTFTVLATGMRIENW